MIVCVTKARFRKKNRAFLFFSENIVKKLGKFEMYLYILRKL